MKKSIIPICLAVLFAVKSFSQVEPVQDPKWYFSPSMGVYDYEGDQVVEDGFLLTFSVGYNLNTWWSFEGSFQLLPSLDGSVEPYGYVVTNAPGDEVWMPVNLLERETGATSTWGAGLALDALFHFTPWKRVDPYLTAGVGSMFYGKDFGSGIELTLRGGGGVMYHFNDMWAVRGDFKFLLANNDTEANSLATAGVVWYWDAQVPFAPTTTEVSDDPDGDGLKTSLEKQIGTDPLDADSDDDGLSDGEEVNKYNTDPLNPDTDSDWLNDGEEVLKYGTNPTEVDTDNGGVMDGHEVMEDHTDPTDGTDDLVKITLYIQFDHDKAVIKPKYYNDLNVIGKVLIRHPGSTARIEGHADRTKKSVASYNKKLSKKRAQAVKAYLEKTFNISSRRLKAIGYGFERPLDPKAVDLINGNPENRRVEIYIKGAGTRSNLEDKGLIPNEYTTPPGSSENK